MTTNPISCATSQSGPCLNLRHIRTATVRKTRQTMIDATITPTILPLRFEWWKAVTSGTVELPSENRKKISLVTKQGKSQPINYQTFPRD